MAVIKIYLLLYQIKEYVNEFPYTYTDENRKKHTVRLTEKRVVILNLKLAKKRNMRINKMIEKVKMLCQAKKSEFGECSKYHTFVYNGIYLYDNYRFLIHYMGVRKDTNKQQ